MARPYLAAAVPEPGHGSPRLFSLYAQKQRPRRLPGPLHGILLFRWAVARSSVKESFPDGRPDLVSQAGLFGESAGLSSGAEFPPR